MNAITSKLAVAAAGVVLAAVPTFARADRFDRGDRYRDHDDRGQVAVEVNVGSRAPEYREVEELRTTRVWVEPVYRTVTDRVWHPAVVRDECERIWVPDRYETRDVVHYEHHRKLIVCENVLVERGHFEDRTHQVVVSEGYWENCNRQELVCAGHFEDQTERVPLTYERPARAGWSFSIGSFLRR
jgi:hypothetical protein